MPTPKSQRRAAASPGAPKKKARTAASRSAGARRKQRRGGKGGGGRWPTALFGLSWAAIAFGVVLLGVPFLLPDPPAVLFAADKQPALTVLDRNGERIGTRGLTHGDRVRLAELPAYLPEAVLAVEDRRFRWHMGIDLYGLTRAVWINWRAGEIVQGGSTITQQLAKNVFLTSERTWERKAQEALYALWLEQKLTKDEILELYLNRVYLGAGTYGVEAASQRYFGKPARNVTLVEAALLAGLLKAPSRYAPTASFERASDRTGLVLDAMVDAGFISDEERQAAYAMPARIRPASATAGSEYILDWIAAQVPDYIGPSTDDVTVVTTIDLSLQRAAETAVADVLSRSGTEVKAEEGALVSLAADGSVRALVGGRAYRASSFNRAVTARRQPGSAFKPFIYLTAIDAGLSPWSVMVDEPVVRGKWAPENYSGTYRGAVTLETALAQSINTVAINLADRVGRRNVIETARHFGIVSPLEPLPSLALGTQEVSLYELTAAYAPLANGGLRTLPYIISEIRTNDGDNIYSRQIPEAARIADPYSIGALNMMLRSALETGTGRRARLPGQIAAGKTGTSGDYRDAWFMGYTARLVTGVWVGNDDGTPMTKVTGGSLPAEIWKSYMTVAENGQPQAPLPFEELATPPPPAMGLTAAMPGNPPGAVPPLPAVMDEAEPQNFFDRIAQALRRHSSVN